MRDDEEVFDHKVTAWTVGQLRQALAGVPDGLPVRVLTAEEPGGEFCGEQVVISAGPWADVDMGAGGTADELGAKLARGELQPDHFEVSLEFPSGQYCRRVR